MGHSYLAPVKGNGAQADSDDGGPGSKGAQDDDVESVPSGRTGSRGMLSTSLSPGCSGALLPTPTPEPRASADVAPPGPLRSSHQALGTTSQAGRQAQDSLKSGDPWVTASTGLGSELSSQAHAADRSLSVHLNTKPSAAPPSSSSGKSRDRSHSSSSSAHGAHRHSGASKLPQGSSSSSKKVENVGSSSSKSRGGSLSHVEAGREVSVAVAADLSQAAELVAGMQLGGNTWREKNTNGAAGVFSLVSAMSNVPIVSTCASLAVSILKAGDRVVANHARCRRLTQRISALLPLLQRLHDIMLRDTRAAADLGAKVEDVAETLRDAHATISGWCSRPANSLRVLLQMVSSNQYQEEFVELHQRLSTSYNDLGLALTLHQMTSQRAPGDAPSAGQAPRAPDSDSGAAEAQGHGHGAVSPARAGDAGAGDAGAVPVLMRVDCTRLNEEAAADLQEDLKALALELGPLELEMAGTVAPEERAALEAAYEAAGLNLDTLLRSARRGVMAGKMADMAIPWSQVKMDASTCLGTGAYGRVLLGAWMGQPVAVKLLEGSAPTERARKDLEREAYIACSLRHPHVATCYGYCAAAPMQASTPGTGHEPCSSSSGQADAAPPAAYALIIKYYKRGTLQALLHDDAQALPWPEVVRLASEVGLGMLYLHSRPYEAIVHGDLKTSNILMDDDGHAAITDFGLSRVSTLTRSLVHADTEGAGVSIGCTAPEILIDPNAQRTCASDVYAFAFVLYELATRQTPFAGARDPFIIWSQVVAGKRPALPEGLPTWYTSLIERCWLQAAHERPGFGEVVEALQAGRQQA